MSSSMSEQPVSDQPFGGMAPGTYLVTVYTHTSPDIQPISILIDDRATYGQAVIQQRDLPVVAPLDSSRLPHLVEYVATSARQLGQQAYTRIAGVAHARGLNHELEHATKAVPIADEVLHLAGDLLAVCWSGGRALGISDLHWSAVVSLPSLCLDVAQARVRGVTEATQDPVVPDSADEDGAAEATETGSGS